MFGNLFRKTRTKLPVLVVSAAIGMVGFAALAQPAVAASNDDLLTVRTASGLVRGKVSDDGAVQVFKGIPFAAAPVGDLRWKAPRPPEPWTGVREAVESGSPCPQTGRLASTNEDCLYLNLWAPGRRTAQKLPVMVFLHGGGQRESAGHEYNGDWLVTRGKPAIFVSINYRLNIFAFLGHKALTAEEPQLGSANYAAMDQIQALRWVKDNIASFGGDPRNVTVFGESGGAQAVCVLMASPPARGLFHRAISESGPCQWQHFPSLTASEQRGADLATQLGCTEPNPLPCLRALPTSTVLAKQQGASSVLDTSSAQPAWGGGMMPLPMRESMASGQFTRVPFMQGSNRDEGLFHMTAAFEGRGNPLTAEQYPTVLARYLGQSRVAAVQQQYPLSNYATPLHALGAALTDSGMASNNRVGLCNFQMANQLMAPHTPLYAYEFADRTAPYPAPIFTVPGNVPGAAHTKELSYLFHQNEITPAQKKISDAMIGYWTNFAATGNPNGKGLPAWPAYKPDRQMVIKFEADKVEADTGLSDRAKCKFWAEQGFATLWGPYPSSTATTPEFK